MGGTRQGSGVEARETSIRIAFTYQGKQRRETLYLNAAPLPPTPANLKYAARVSAEIRDKIKSGTFDYADYFPHAKMAKEKQAGVTYLHAWMDAWYGLLELKASTKSMYKRQIDLFWKKHLADKPIADYVHSDIVAALKLGTWKSGKSRNNQLSIIKSVFEAARRDRLITVNPCDEIERAAYQKPHPDPFSLDEVKMILAFVQAHYDPQIWNYEQTKFFTGMRTSEIIALKWSDVDFVSKYAMVRKGLVYEETGDVKTSVARKVRLNSMALEALTRQKDHTFLADGIIFHDPFYKEPWLYHRITDSAHWTMTLKRCGLRYRAPYNSRHTYATIGLMSGARPGFLAKQLGHSLRVFFEVYADWISSDDDGREMDKIESSIKQINPDLTQEQDAA